MALARLLAVVLLLAGCGEVGPQPQSRDAAAMRIASLSPALTSTLVHMGWKDRVVGRTPWCAGVDQVPVVGSLLEVDLERLSAVKPDLIVVQATAAGVPGVLVQAAAEHGWRVVQVPCTSLAQVRSLETALAEAARAPAPATDTSARWAKVLQPLDAAPRQSPCVLLFASDPPQAFGSDAYLAEVWKAWGGAAVPSQAGHPSMRMEDLFALQPRTVTLIGPEASASCTELAVACADRGVQFVVVNQAGLLRPGPEALDAIERWREQLERAP
jgi:iron complex transport system substrate-binding protein